MKKICKNGVLTKKEKTEIAKVLMRLCTDESQKPTDRISAAKLLIDMDIKASEKEPDGDDALHVVFEGAVPGYVSKLK
ncbi:MAG: hypothetical protein IJA35_03635 [Clostridia bacterium]|nr:hypothetical protein [Clostridia bacterium]